MTGSRAAEGRVVIASACAATRNMLGTLLDVDETLAPAVHAPNQARAVALAAGAPLVLLDARDARDPCDLGLRVAALRGAPGSPEVVVLSDVAAPATVRKALDAGAVSFLLTWADARQLHATIAAALDRRGMVDTAVVRPVLDLCAEVVNDVRRRDRAVIESLTQAVDAKDVVTGNHLRAVSDLAKELAHQVDPEIAASDDFGFGCLLHDVGKIGVPEHILTKPGPLSEDEWVVMRRHPDTGARVVTPLGLSETVLDVVRYHHERWDGGGYPFGLAGEEIPLVARIFSVCDALEAMTAARPYRAPLLACEALERVRVGAGSQFDADVVAALWDGVGRGEISVGPRITARRTGPGGRRRRGASHP
jgi:putative nucleotidyltransferase with HDIG domain